ncbi:MAG: LytTR family DNA-binding domain-containing protein [Bacteroidota bacterium]
MSRISCIIVDDEPLARAGLEDYVQQIDFLELKAVCKNAMEANTFLNRNEVDLLFLDIEMPKLSGMAFLRSLPNSPAVIFTTAYTQYALEGYNFNVIDYLLKPISFERFLQASNKALRLLSKQSETENHIFVKTDKQLVKINISDILFVESMQNYVVFHLNNDKIMTLTSLKSLVEWLPQKDFIMVHRSYLVAKSKVEAVIGNQLLIGEHKIPISTRMRKQVLEELTKDRLLNS